MLISNNEILLLISSINRRRKNDIAAKNLKRSSASIIRMLTFIQLIIRKTRIKRAADKNVSGLSIRVNNPMLSSIADIL